MYPYEVIDSKTVEIECYRCQEAKKIEVGELGLKRLMSDSMLIQDALPEVPKELREMFLSGICPSCFAKVFGCADEDDEEYEESCGGYTMEEIKELWDGDM